MNDMKNKENRTLRIDHDIKVQATKLVKSLGLEVLLLEFSIDKHYNIMGYHLM